MGFPGSRGAIPLPPSPNTEHGNANYVTTISRRIAPVRTRLYTGLVNLLETLGHPSWRIPCRGARLGLRNP